MRPLIRRLLGLSHVETRGEKKVVRFLEANLQKPPQLQQQNDQGSRSSIAEEVKEGLKFAVINLLISYVWPWGRRFAIQHDAYLCKRFPGSQAWPVQRVKEPNNFVASVVAENATLWQRCPPICRPKDHPNWEHC